MPVIKVFQTSIQINLASVKKMWSRYCTSLTVLHLHKVYFGFYIFQLSLDELYAQKATQSNFKFLVKGKEKKQKNFKMVFCRFSAL